jgi:hypothetical protein
MVCSDSDFQDIAAARRTGASDFARSRLRDGSFQPASANHYGKIVDCNAAFSRDSAKRSFRWDRIGKSLQKERTRSAEDIVE